MTFCTVLATEKKNGVDITAYEMYEKFSKTPHYEICLSRNGDGFQQIHTAKTTWKRKFKQVVEDL